MNSLFNFSTGNRMKGLAALVLCACLCACTPNDSQELLKAAEGYTSPLSDSQLAELNELYRKAVRAHDYPAMEKSVGELIKHSNNMNDHKQALLLANDYLGHVMDSGDSSLIPPALYYTGVIYFNSGLPSYSIEYFLKIHDYPISERMRCRTYYAMGENARTIVLNNALSPIEYYRKAEAIARKLNDSIMTGYALFGQSQLLFDSMGAYKVPSWSDGMKDSLALSTALLEEAIASARTLDNPAFIVALSLNYAAQGRFDKALAYREAIESYRSIPKYTSMTFNCLAAIGHYMKDYDAVIRLGKESYDNAVANDRSFDTHNAADILAYAYKAKGDYKSAVHYHEIVRELEDKQKKNDGDKEVLALQVKFDLKMKEQLIAHQRLQLIWSLTVAGIIAAGMLVLIYFYRQKQAAWRNLVRQIGEQDCALAELEQLRDKNQQLSALLAPDKEDSDESEDELFVRVNRRIKEQRLFTDCDLSRSSVALETGVNERALFDCIKKNKGLSFTEYINALRLDFARELLTQADQKFTLEGIAREAGFGSRSTFYRVFRTAYGISPDVFRKLAKKTQITPTPTPYSHVEEEQEMPERHAPALS